MDHDKLTDICQYITDGRYLSVDVEECTAQEIEYLRAFAENRGLGLVPWHSTCFGLVNPVAAGDLTGFVREYKVHQTARGLRVFDMQDGPTWFSQWVPVEPCDKEQSLIAAAMFDQGWWVE